ncbi:MAG: hypothetical protein HUU43_10305 [Ignavibacteriaceae bacterium]|nr:hypothetical protein [Ignavibacteriaceae bacterium]
MVTRTAIKQALMARLADQIELLDIDQRIAVEDPEILQDFRPVHPRGAVFVVYDGTVYEDNGLENGVLQDCTHKFQVYVAVKRISIKTDAERTLYRFMQPEQYVEYVTEAIAGLVVISDTRDKAITIREDKFMAEMEGVWMYQITVDVAGGILVSETTI